MRPFMSLQPLSIQQYVLYRLRFAADAALCSAFDVSGGTIDRINNIAIITQISILEIPKIDMLYDVELQNRLSKYARARTPAVDYYNLLSTLRIDIVRTILQRAAQSFAAASRLPAKGKGGKGEKCVKGEKGDKAKGKRNKSLGKKPIDSLKENEWRILFVAKLFIYPSGRYIDHLIF